MFCSDQTPDGNDDFRIFLKDDGGKGFTSPSKINFKQKEDKRFHKDCINIY